MRRASGGPTTRHLRSGWPTSQTIWRGSSRCSVWIALTSWGCPSVARSRSSCTAATRRPRERLFSHPRMPGGRDRSRRTLCASVSSDGCARWTTSMPTSATTSRSSSPPRRTRRTRRTSRRSPRSCATPGCQAWIRPHDRWPRPTYATSCRGSRSPCSCSTVMPIPDHRWVSPRRCTRRFPGRRSSSFRASDTWQTWMRPISSTSRSDDSSRRPCRLKRRKRTSFAQQFLPSAALSAWCGCLRAAAGALILRRPDNGPGRLATRACHVHHL
jgi:hypothetical protein